MIRAMVLTLFVGATAWATQVPETPPAPKVWTVSALEKRFDPPRPDGSPGDTFYYAKASSGVMKSWGSDQLWITGRVKEADLPTGEKVTYVEFRIYARSSKEIGLQKQGEKVKLRWKNGSDSSRKWIEFMAPASFSTQDSVQGVSMLLNVPPQAIQETVIGDNFTIELSPGFMIVLREPGLRGLKGMAP